MRNQEQNEKISQEQLYDLLLSKELSWQEIIYDLIASEQLDPWDIDLALLASRYIERIQQMEEASFFISSKVLLSASILLRIKSEILLNRYIKSLDDILFGKEESSESREQERIILDAELPELLPKTPLPRMRKVSLNELMQALEHAINTEHRRIKKEIYAREIERKVAIILPRTRVDIRAKIKEIYNKIKEFFLNKPDEKLTFSILAGSEKTEKIATFIPLLHLHSQSRVDLQQEGHFQEIYIWLKKHEEELTDSFSQEIGKEEGEKEERGLT